MRIAQLFNLRLGTGLKTSAAKHTLVPTKCLSTDTKCNVTQTQAKNDYVLTPEELVRFAIEHTLVVYTRTHARTHGRHTTQLNTCN